MNHAEEQTVNANEETSNCVPPSACLPPPPPPPPCCRQFLQRRAKELEAARKAFVEGERAKREAERAQREADAKSSSAEYKVVCSLVLFVLYVFCTSAGAGLRVEGFLLPALCKELLLSGRGAHSAKCGCWVLGAWKGGGAKGTPQGPLWGQGWEREQGWKTALCPFLI